MNRIAIIGGGFSGLASAWHVLNEGKGLVTLFDGKGIGNGASGAATGLMHPYPGKEARLSWRAKEGMEATLNLLSICEEEIGKPLHCKGILRHAINPAQMLRFKEISLSDPDVELLQEGIFLKSGVTIFSREYLDGLFQVCIKKGAAFIEKQIEDIKELDKFDRVIFAGGASTLNLGLNLPINFVKGQSLLCNSKLPLEHSHLEHGFLAVTGKKNMLNAGSTYERDFENDQPDLEIAKKQIFQKMKRFRESLEVIECRAGIRVMNKNHYFPLVGKLSERIFYITAMGSRGLLYHSLLARELVRDV